MTTYLLICRAPRGPGGDGGARVVGGVRRAVGCGRVGSAGRREKRSCPLILQNHRRHLPLPSWRNYWSCCPLAGLQYCCCYYWVDHLARRHPRGSSGTLWGTSELQERKKGKVSFISEKLDLCESSYFKTETFMKTRVYSVQIRLRSCIKN